MDIEKMAREKHLQWCKDRALKQTAHHGDLTQQLVTELFLNGDLNTPEKMDIEKMAREKYLQWCKDRALKQLESGRLNGAFLSMLTDILRHPDTAHHGGLTQYLATELFLNGDLNTSEKMKKWINGYN